MMKEISVIIIDDHPLFRQGVADTLSLEDDLNVVDQADNGDDGLKLIKEIVPDVAIIDVNLPLMNGHQVTRSLVADGIGTRVILLTAYDDLEQMIHAISSGAKAYCTKDVKPENLVGIVHHVVQGKYVINDDVIDPTEIEKWMSQKSEQVIGAYSVVGEPYQPLSPREMEVLIYITQGMSNKEIANTLVISHQTVKNHVTSILRKLGVDDRTQAAIYALRHGWVQLHEVDMGGEE